MVLPGKMILTSIDRIFSMKSFGRYPICGSMQDFNYLASNCFELTIELGCQNFPAGKKLRRLWEDNKRSMLNFMWQVMI